MSERGGRKGEGREEEEDEEKEEEEKEEGREGIDSAWKSRPQKMIYDCITRGERGRERGGKKMKTGEGGGNNSRERRENLADCMLLVCNYRPITSGLIFGLVGILITVLVSYQNPDQAKK